MRKQALGVVTALVVVAACGGQSPAAPSPTPTPSPGRTITRLAVTSTGEVAVDAATPFLARASYTDGTVTDVTAQAVWLSATPDLARVDSRGIVTGVKAGPAAIRASFGGFTDEVPLTVGPRHVTITMRITSFVCVQDCDAGTKGDGDFVYIALAGWDPAPNTQSGTVLSQTTAYPNRGGIIRLAAGDTHTINTSVSFPWRETSEKPFRVAFSATEWDTTSPDSRLDNESAWVTYTWEEKGGWGSAPGEHRITLGESGCIVRLLFSLEFKY
jgi:hypothetical protein